MKTTGPLQRSSQEAPGARLDSTNAGSALSFLTPTPLVMAKWASSAQHKLPLLACVGSRVCQPICHRSLTYNTFASYWTYSVSTKAGGGGWGYISMSTMYL